MIDETSKRIMSRCLRASAQQDEENRHKHIAKGLRAFKKLLRSVSPYADMAKSEHFENIPKQRRHFIKLIKNLPEVDEYLSKNIGTLDTHASAYSWRSAILYALRDRLINNVKLKSVMVSVEKQLSKGFQALEMEKSQAVIRRTLPPQFMEFLPKNIVVEVDPNRKIKRITDRFENERLTLEVKRKRMLQIIRDYNKIVRQVKKDLKDNDEITRLSALITAIIMETGIRPGSAGTTVTQRGDDGVEIETFGAITLGPPHVRFIRRNFAELEFAGKMGSINTASLTNTQIIKILKDYVKKATKKNLKYIFVSNDGTPFTYTDLQRYFRDNFKGISPTDFRKLKATQTVLESLVDQQEDLYVRISQFLDLEEEELKERLVKEITISLNRALEMASMALSHGAPTTTTVKKHYIDPQIILRFLSTGKIENTLKDAIIKNKTTLVFSPEKFIEQARTRLGQRSKQAGQVFVDGKSPNNRWLRFKLVDPTGPDRKGGHYFEDEYEWFGVTGKRLKRPRLVEKGEPDPKTVAFIDYSGSGATYFGEMKIHIVASREGGRGIAQKLLREFYRQKFPNKKGYVNWGRIMNPAAVHIFKKMMKAYPDISHKGVDLASHGIGKGMMSPSRTAARPIHFAKARRVASRYLKTQAASTKIYYSEF